MSPTAIHAAYIVSSILFIVGLRQLSSPKTARNGNTTAAVGMLLALVATLLDSEILSFPLIFAALVLGSGVGAVAARRVAMTDMPAIVAPSRLGGLAAARSRPWSWSTSSGPSPSCR